MQLLSVPAPHEPVVSINPLRPLFGQYLHRAPHSDPPPAAANTSGTEAGSQSSASNWPRICRMSSSSSVVHHHHQFVKLFSGWTENAGARTSKPLTLAMPDKLHRVVLGARWAERPSSGVAPAERSREQPNRTPGDARPFEPMEYSNVRYAKALPYSSQ